MESPAVRIIGKFEGVRKLARALGHAHPTTVQGWHERGIIPTRQIPAVIEAGRSQGVVLKAEDFLPTASNTEVAL